MGERFSKFYSYIISYIFWIVPLGLFILALFLPKTSTYIYLAILILFELYLYFIDIFNRPKPNNNYWNYEELRIIKEYHLAIRYSYGAKIFSIILNGFRFTIFIWVPLLLINSFWIPAIILVINFFFTGSLAVRLDPIFYLKDAVKKGKMKYYYELSLIQQVMNKYISKGYRF